jgi:ferric-dicitrate binding protein FerR (iron transport regulator)
VDGDRLERVLAAQQRGLFSRPLPPRAAPRRRREGAGRGLAVIGAINLALLWAGANAPTEFT